MPAADQISLPSDGAYDGNYESTDTFCAIFIEPLFQVGTLNILDVAILEVRLIKISVKVLYCYPVRLICKQVNTSKHAHSGGRAKAVGMKGEASGVDQRTYDPRDATSVNRSMKELSRLPCTSEWFAASAEITIFLWSSNCDRLVADSSRASLELLRSNANAVAT